MLPVLFGRDRAVREAFAARGAVSAITARPLRDFPPMPAERLAGLLDRGVIREGPPGTYYLYLRQSPPPTARRVIFSLLFWLLILLLPVAVISLTNR